MTSLKQRIWERFEKEFENCDLMVHPVYNPPYFVNHNNLHDFLDSIIDEALDAAIGAVPEPKDIGYEEEQEKPLLEDEFKADLYETKAEAWFAGWDNCVKQTLLSLEKLKKEI